MMRRRHYLNAILTVNAILLTGVIWVVGADRAPFAATARADEPRGIPDAGSQRNEMIRELRRLNEQMEALRKDFDERVLNVKVTEMPPVKIEGERD